MNFPDAIKELRRSATVSVPFTGKVLAGMTPNASYEAAKRGKLGVPTFMVGKRIRVASLHVLEKLGIASELDPLDQDAIQAAPEPAAGVLPRRDIAPAGAIKLTAARPPPTT